MQDKIDDADVIFTVYEEVMKFVNSFRTTDGEMRILKDLATAEDTETMESSKLLDVPIYSEAKRYEYLRYGVYGRPNLLQRSRRR